MTRKPLNITLPEKLIGRLKAAADKTANPYAPTVSSIIEQGAEKELRLIEASKKECEKLSRKTL